MNFRDVELLSAYLDGRLNPSEAARLEARLSADTNLKSSLDDLRQTRALLRQLPQRRAPRNFRLTPKMAGIRPPAPRAYPAFRLATGLVALLFVAAVGLNAVVPFAASRLAAPTAPQGYGMGGGGGGAGGSGQEESQLAGQTEAPPQAPLAAAMPTMTAEGTMSIEAATEAPAQAQDTGPAEATEEAANKSALAQPPGAQEAASAQPVPVGLIIVLGVATLVFAAVAWLLRSRNDQRIRGRWNQK
jgi:hypothetical protein